MKDYNNYIGLDQPATYEIHVQGRLETCFPDWFHGEVIRRVENAQEGVTVTILTGQVIDQAALHGLIKQVRDLGLALLFIDCLSAHNHQPDNQ